MSKINDSFTTEEWDRYIYLRAVEWGTLISFVAMGLTTPLLLLMNPWVLLISIVVLNFIWSISFADRPSLRLADSAVYLNKLKWLTTPITAAIFIAQGNYGYAALSVLWPMIVMFAGLLHISKPVGTIQKKFYAQAHLK